MKLLLILQYAHPHAQVASLFVISTMVEMGINLAVVFREIVMILASMHVRHKKPEKNHQTAIVTGDTLMSGVASQENLPAVAKAQ